MGVRHDHEWEYPLCPECESNVFVEFNNHVLGRDECTRRREYYECVKCDVTFGELLFERWPDGDYRQEEWLRREYIEEDRTRADIATEFDVSVGTIEYWLSKHGVLKHPEKASDQTNGKG